MIVEAWQKVPISSYSNVITSTDVSLVSEFLEGACALK